MKSNACCVPARTLGVDALVLDGGPPDLIISNSRLADGKTAPIPAFVITGDTAPERLREASVGGLHLLHKPVSPAALRATLHHTTFSGSASPPAGKSRRPPPDCLYARA